MRLAVAAEGAAASSHPFVEGCLRAASDLDAGLVFFGPAEPLRRALRSLAGAGAPRVEVHDVPAQPSAPSSRASAALSAGEPPAVSAALRAAQAAASGTAEAVAASGPAPALAAAALWHLKRLEGVLRPALACPVSTARGPKLLVDAGISFDSKPWHLLQFAWMGALYVSRLSPGVKPSVALVSPLDADPEPELVREAVPLLEESGLDFRGPAGADVLADGGIDVAVCDGALGDVCLRLHDGLSSLVREKEAAGALERLVRAWSGAPEAPPPASDVAVLLGVNGAVTLCRRPESSRAAERAVREAAALARGNLRETISRRLEGAKTA